MHFLSRPVLACRLLSLSGNQGLRTYRPKVTTLMPAWACREAIAYLNYLAPELIRLSNLAGIGARSETLLKKLIRFPSGSRNSIDLVPQG